MSIESDLTGSLGIETSDPLLSLVNKDKVATEEFSRIHKRRFAAWTSYDVANTFYASGILSFTSLVWILVIGQRNGLSYGTANFLYGAVFTISSIIMAVLLPILGSLSDVTQQRKNFVIVFTIISIISTYAFLLLDSFWPLLIAFAISMIFYQWAQVFYDAMLPGVVPPGKEARWSSIAITIGYLGGAVVTLYAFYLSKTSTEPNADPSQGVLTLGYSKPLIVAVVVGFTLLSIPIFFIKETNWEEVSKLVFLDDLDEWNAIYVAFLSETDETQQIPLKPPRRSIWQISKESLSDLKASFIEIYHNNRGMFFYIVAYFIIADLANLMAIINVEYLRSGIGFDEDQVFAMILVSGVSLILFTPIIGVVCDVYGAKRGFYLVGGLWFFSLFIMIFQGILFPQYTLFLAAITFGPASSGVWVAQRQMVLELVPNDEEIGKYFGLTKFSGKLSSAVGPIIFTSIFLFIESKYNYLDNYIQVAYRWAIAALSVFLAFGFWILVKFVPDKSDEFKIRKQRIADAIDAADKKQEFTLLS